MILESDVRAALDDVTDPCSEVAGLPAGIVEMGLVTHLAVDQSPNGAIVSLAIRVTEPTCLMGPSLASGARARVEALPGVARVDVTLSDDNEWVPAAMSAEYRGRLAAHRAARRGAVEVQETALGAPIRIRR
ncbi:MAG: metal-sulfur cluster assembly factor [Acidimicrobiia bacterium]